MLKLSFKFLPFFILIIFLSACAKKPAPTPPITQEKEELADIRNFPQNLDYYAKRENPNKLLISPARQESYDAAFNNTWFGPWQMRKTSISRREIAQPFGKAWGYKTNGSRWTQPEWNQMRANANLAAFPSRSAGAITIRPTDLRELPTHETKFDKLTADASKYPFDYFQYSFLPLGMPVFIAHTTADGKWHYIECPIAGGWVDAKDVAPVDASFMALWKTGRYAAIVKDKTRIPGAQDAIAGIGTILPIAGGSEKSGLKVLRPFREANGMAGCAEVDLAPRDAVIKPMPLTPANVAAVGNQMMNQPYGWGGMLGLRDCSAMIRDIFAPFGIWLPRNSAAQARRGKVISLAGLNMRQKENVIMRDGVPFLSLVGLPGHITLYVGTYKNQPAIFHNAWGVRVIKDGNDDERYVIGRAVVTSIAPGMDLPNLYRPRTFTDRVRSLSIIGH